VALRLFGRLSDRRPQAMLHRLICRFGFYFALLLQGCSMPGTSAPTSNSYGSTSSRDLLSQLASCLAEVRATSNQSFTSSCAALHVSRLRGITLAQLKTSLGAPGISSDDYIHVPADPKAPREPYECRWAFYNLPEGYIGGGPELQCVSPDRATCKKVRWVETQ